MIVKQFPASLDYLYKMLAFVRDYAEEAGFGTKDMSKIELAAEEAIVNIISYGYHPAQEGQIEISCAAPNPQSVKIMIKDNGIPYNPLAHAKEEMRRLHPNLNECTVGGYGIYFIMKMMDEVNYQREQDFNVLTLLKKKAH